MIGPKRCRKPGCGANIATGHPCTDYDCPEHFVLASDYQAMEKARAAAIAALQSENARMREATLREAAKIVRDRADFSLSSTAKKTGHKPIWHHFANSCADTLEQIATLSAPDVTR